MDKNCELQSPETLRELIAEHQKYLRDNHLDSAYQMRWDEVDSAILSQDPLRLDNAHLNGVDLSGQDLRYANLASTDFTGARLNGTKFGGAVADSADFSQTNLIKANFERASARSACFWQSQLMESVFTSSDLSYKVNATDFSEASLRGSHLENADLRSAYFKATDLSDADFAGASVWYAFYEPKKGPPLGSIALAHGLDTLRWDQDLDELKKIDPTDDVTLSKRWLFYLACTSYLEVSHPGGGEPLCTLTNGGGPVRSFFKNLIAPLPTHFLLRNAGKESDGELDNPYPLMDLRNALRNSGYEHAELAVNLAYRRHLQSNPEMVLFDWTCEYGRAPWRPFLIATALAVLVIPVYWVGFRFRLGSTLYRVVTIKNDEIRTPVAVQTHGLFAQCRETPKRIPSLLIKQLNSELKMIKYVALFSLISVIDLGFETLDFGRWVRNLFWTEYDLKAEGWLRMVSGLQALLGLGLLALCVLSLLGSHFE
jgi:uncharacterized protein YjbI with pentapeptide repeats